MIRNTYKWKKASSGETKLLYISIYFITSAHSQLVSWYFLALVRSQLMARWADSFIMSPSWPVRVSWPSPSIRLASTNMISPPNGVQARPRATPGRVSRSDTFKQTNVKMWAWGRGVWQRDESGEFHKKLQVTVFLAYASSLLTSMSNSGGPRMSLRAIWSITIGISGGAAFSENRCKVAKSSWEVVLVMRLSHYTVENHLPNTKIFHILGEEVPLHESGG